MRKQFTAYKYAVLEKCLRCLYVKGDAYTVISIVLRKVKSELFHFILLWCLWGKKIVKRSRTLLLETLVEILIKS
jgi:hypothetical protein